MLNISILHCSYKSGENNGGIAPATEKVRGKRIGDVLGHEP